ncbi:hypothetical protein [Calothrix sp. NIES-2098]
MVKAQLADSLQQTLKDFKSISTSRKMRSPSIAANTAQLSITVG